MTLKSGGIGSWIVLAILVLLLALAIVFMLVGWDIGEGGGQPISGAGYVAMVFGIVVTLGLGVGLMMLLFHSSRQGHD